VLTSIGSHPWHTGRREAAEIPGRERHLFFGCCETCQHCTLPAPSVCTWEHNGDVIRQQRDIEEMLVDEGWLVVGRERPDLWWLDEVWVLESGWSPIGETAYVGFIVDPQAASHRRRGEEVWAVRVTREHPAGPSGLAGEVPLRPNWERLHRAEVRAQIRGLRRRISIDDDD
jgi:hypothetical protein